MSNDVASARAELDRAQTLLDEVEADLAHFDRHHAWPEGTPERVERLFALYRGPVQQHLRTVLADDPTAVTPPVANEDAVWEAYTGFHDRCEAAAQDG